MNNLQTNILQINSLQTNIPQINSLQTNIPQINSLQTNILQINSLQTFRRYTVCKRATRYKQSADTTVCEQNSLIKFELYNLSKVIWIKDKIMINKLPVNIKKIKPNATVPTYGSANAAGADLYACIDSDITIASGETILIPTGLSMELPEGYAGLIYARSGLASKKGLAPANKVGVVDSDYRGEVMVALHNHSNKDAVIEPGERIAQLVITPYLMGIFTEVDALGDTERGSGGFGSTGTH